MARDFTTYKHEPSTIDGKRLYKYQPLGGRETSKSEVSVALDFGEIVALEVERKALPRKVS